MRLAVVMPSLAGGGIERMRLHLIKEWLKDDIEIDLVVTKCEGSLRNLVPSNVKVYEMGRWLSIISPFMFIVYLFRRNPSHILSAANDVNVIVLLAGKIFKKNTPIVVSFHNHISTELSFKRGLKLIKIKIVLWLLSKLIGHAVSVIAVSKGLANDLEKYFFNIKSKIEVIYNPVITEEFLASLEPPELQLPFEKHSQWILFAGRLVHQKGIDVLIDAFHIVSKKSTAHLVLVGEGPLKDKLSKKTNSLDLTTRVHFINFQMNVIPWMINATAFALPSRHEGLGNVLIEAMACGTQIISTDCPSGPAEILDNGKYGQLVPQENPEALAEAILKSLNGEFAVVRDVLKSRAELFSSKSAAAKYLSILRKNN